MTAPERIWVQWPHANGAGLAFTCNARPPALRHEYIRADPTPPAQSVPEVASWMPIETAPKDGLIDIWLSKGVRWCDCYYDRICDEWRTSRPSGRLVHIGAADVSYWMPRPAPPTAALRGDAEHVNETAETEHDAGNVLTDASAALAVPEVRALVDSATALVQAMCDDTDIMAKWHIVEKMNEVAAGFRALRGEGGNG